MSADDLAKLLDELGRRLGPAGEHVFALAVQRVIVGGVVGLILGAVLIAVGVVGGRFLWRWVTEPGQGPYSDRPMGGALLGFALIVGTVFGVFSVSTAVIQLLTPEYSALENLLRAVTGGVK